MGVRAAVEKASRTLSLSSGKAVCCLHELVHNEQVVADLKARGMRFVESLDDVPDGATVLFSAHGVAPAVRDEAQRRGLAVVDATCPFVARAHRAVREFATRGVPVVVVGRPEHAEVRGVVGECADARVVGTPVLVLGSAGSSNTNRLVEVARAAGASFAARAGTLEEVRARDFAGVRRLGVTAGASTPEDFLARVVADFGILAP